MTWAEFKKANNIVFPSWILKSLELVKVSDNISEMTELTLYGESLAKVKIMRGIFQGASFCLSFAICIIPPTYVLHKVKARQTLEEGEKINHLLCMDDLKLYGKSKNEIKGLVPTVKVFC